MVECLGVVLYGERSEKELYLLKRRGEKLVEKKRIKNEGKVDGKGKKKRNNSFRLGECSVASERLKGSPHSRLAKDELAGGGRRKGLE